MEISSQSSVIGELKNLEVYSETENFSSQISEIAKEVAEVHVASSSTALTEPSASSSSNSSSESSSTSSSSPLTSTTEEPAKHKRKRKRKRKKKTNTSAAYEPPEPFTHRYKRIKLSAEVPKLHIRFDDAGNPDQINSKYSLKPRIIKALEYNLSVDEEFVERNTQAENSKEPTPGSEWNRAKCGENIVISLKPRIIKAIVV